MINVDPLRHAIVTRSFQIICGEGGDVGAADLVVPAFDPDMLVRRLSSKPGEICLPLPIPVAGAVPDCFDRGVSSGDCLTARYFPRATFSEFVAFMDPNLLRGNSKYNLRGVVGGGKSHILLAYAFYRMACRFNRPQLGVPRIIYVH